MSQQFKEQGGAATMDPNPLYRWLTSKVLSRLSKSTRLEKQRARIERRRARAGLKHVVEYFHQVDDGYSYLAAQVLQSFTARYDVQLVCHLVSGPEGNNSVEPDLLLQLSRYDASLVAPEYGLNFPDHPNNPDPDLVSLASQILAAQSSDNFVSVVAEVSCALWKGDKEVLLSLAKQRGCRSEEAVAEKIRQGNARRSELKHYSGAMFYYGREWYWGVDRLYHLEKRLAQLHADLQPGEPLLMPRPPVEVGSLKDDGSLTLEVFPSLRSPYTAISFDRTVRLARETGVNLVVRPVLPMVMRGVPATREKGFYVFTDTAREARAENIPFGNTYDPIGDPVRRAYSLYPWACEQGKGIELLSSFLRCAFVEGVNTTNNKGLKKVVEKAGLDWTQARAIVGKPGWEAELESNRQAMYQAGLWGVPSFRLLNDRGEQLLGLWGQDRLWLFAREIQRQLELRQ